MTETSDDSWPSEPQDSDYDGAWKEALRFHLREFLERCFSALANLIDWTSEPEWLDKEISQIIGRLGRRNREVDVLFKVRLIDGRNQWILCHLEIQTSYESDFARRMNLYNAGLEWHFQRDVLTLMILADLNPQWRPSEYRFKLGGFETLRRFPVCKIIDKLATDWTDDISLVTQVARAQIEALRTASDPEARYRAKTQLVRNLYNTGFGSARIRELFRLIDWMMHLRLDLSRKFEVELVEYEKELQMPYVTSVERIAEERGLEKGLEKGLERGREEGRGEATVTLVLRQLTRLYGALPLEIEMSVRRLSLGQVQSLGESLFDFGSIEDLKRWLETVVGESD